MFCQDISKIFLFFGSVFVDRNYLKKCFLFLWKRLRIAEPSESVLLYGTGGAINSPNADPIFPPPNTYALAFRCKDVFSGKFSGERDLSR